MNFDRLLKIAVLGVVILGGVKLARPNTFRLLGVVLTGRTQCPFGATMASLDSTQAIIAAKNRIHESMQLVRADGSLQLWDTPQGQMWIPASQLKWMPLVLAEQQERIYGRGERGVHQGDIVLDCGAAMGEFTRTALDQGAAIVVAIEPAPFKEPCLRRNFEREIAAGRVIVYPKGVWDKEASLTLYDDSVVEKREGTGIVVPLTTIDQLVADLHLPRVDFIKMDIEGAEKQALTGARATIQKYHPRMSIATEHLADDPVAIPQLVRSMAAYQLQCGPCEWDQDHIRPQVDYFY